MSEKSCRKCKYSDVDLISCSDGYYEAYFCEKQNNKEIEECEQAVDCETYEEEEPCVYEDTRVLCGACERLSECIKNNHVIECTVSEDPWPEFSPGRSLCPLRAAHTQGV